MNKNVGQIEGVTLLGSGDTKYNSTYDPSVLETFQNKHLENDYVVSFDAYEFTSTCPITGQPDFAKIIISYIPNEKMVESKSLKLYLFSFRNTGEFHENCINTIMKDLRDLMQPKYLEVRGIFSPRGGIAIYPFATYYDPSYPEFAEYTKQRNLDILRDSSNRVVSYNK